MSDVSADLTINLGMAKEAAAQAARELRANLRQNHGGILSDAQVVEKAQTELIRRENAQRIQEAARTTKTTVEQAKEVAREQAKAAKESARDQAAAVKEASRAVADSARDQIAHAKELTLARQAAARDLARVDKEIAVSAREAAKASKESSSAQAKAAKEAADAHGEVSSTLDSILTKYGSLTAAVAVVKDIGRAWAEVADQQRNAFMEYMRLQKEARVGAAVKGTSAEQYAPETLKISSSSGLKFNEADDLSRQFEGSLPIGIQKGNIDRKTADELLMQTAKSGARLGGDQATRGELAGLLAQFGKVGSAEEGLGKLEAVRKQLVDGRGDDAPLTKSLLHAAPALIGSGMIGSIEEAAALIGTTSLTGGAGMSDTLAVQLTRAVRGTTKEQAAGLERHFGIKANSQEDFESRMDKIAPKLKEMQAGGQDVYSFLRDEIKMPAENIEAVQGFLPNFGAYKDRAKTARETGKTGGAGVIAANQAWQGSTLGSTSIAEAQSEAGKYIQGNRVKDFGALSAKAKAEIDTQDDTNYNRLQGAANKVTREGIFGFGLNMFGVGTQAEERVNARLAAELGKHGMSDPFSTWGGTLRGMTMTPADRGTEMMQMLKNKGVDTLNIVGDKTGSKVLDALDGIMKELKAQTPLLKEQVQPLKSLPQQGQPTRMPARPGE